MKKISVILLLSFLPFFPSFAQSKYMLEVETDKKILNIDQIGLPETASIYDALSILPELLTRTKEEIMDNYEIKIDGFSLGKEYIGTLSQIRVGQVKKLEVSNSPLESYRNNGQGGSIDIILNDLEEGVSGEVSLSAYTIFNVEPMALVGYKKGAFTFRGMAEVNHYNPLDFNSSSRCFQDQKLIYEETDTTKEKYTSETVRLMMEYKPTDNDLFKLRVSENVSWDERNDYFTRTGEQPLFLPNEKQNTGKNVSIDANASFKHTFSRGSSFKLESSYSIVPKNDLTVIPEFKELGSEDMNCTISGKIEYQQNLESRRPENFTHLIFGANTNYSNGDKFDHIMYKTDGAVFSNINSIIHNWFLSPYIKFDSRYGRWRLKAELEYQSFFYEVRGLDNEIFKKTRRDVTGKLMAGFQINDNNHLQLILDRKLERPDGSMLYPYVTFNPDLDRFEYGNPDLFPMIINEISLNYISNFSCGIHDFVFDADLSYMKVNDVLSPVIYTHEPRYETYATYINSGKSHILSGKLAFIYRVGMFTLSLTGNVNDNKYDLDNSNEHFAHYNISVFPALNLPQGWKASARFVYHSKVYTSALDLGSVATLALSAGKSWDRFSVYAIGSIPLNGKTVDISRDGLRTIEKSYFYTGTNAGLMLNYKF